MREKNRFSFNIWSTLLVIGVITAPMTSLRIWKFGIAEVSILMWSVKILLDTRLKFKIDYFILLILLLDACLFIGFFYRIFFDIYTGTYIEESITFLFFTFFIIILSQYLQKTETKNILLVLKGIFYGGFTVYFGLYLYSIFISRKLLGWDLWYGGERLAILADNPHQFVFFIGPASLVGLFLIKINFIKSKKEKIFSYIAICGYLLMGIETKSSTLLATFSTIIIIILLFKSRGLKNNKKKNILFICMKLSFSTAVFLAFLYPVINVINNFIESDPNGLGRFVLWESGIKMITSYPLFGLGPGAHLYNPTSMRFEEAHNTYVDIALRGGIFALIIYLTILIKSLIMTKTNIYAVSIILFFCFYGIAGFSFRRITLWFFIMTIVYIYKKSKRKEFNPDIN